MANITKATLEEMSINYRRKLGRLIMEEIRNTRSAMDLKIKYQGNCFVGSKLLLAACSEFFYYVFTEYKMNPINFLVLPEVDPEAMSCILTYMHSGKWETALDTKIHDKIFKTLQEFGAAKMKKHRIRIMCRNLSPESFLEIWNLAYLLELTEMETIIATFVITNLELCSRMEKFCHLKLNRMIAVLSKDEAGSLEPCVIGFAIYKWIAFNIKSRKKFLNVLLLILKTSIDLRILIKEYVKNLLELMDCTYPLLKEQTLRSNLYKDAILVKKSSNNQRLVSLIVKENIRSSSTSMFMSNREHLKMLLAKKKCHSSISFPVDKNEKNSEFEGIKKYRDQKSTASLNMSVRTLNVTRFITETGHKHSSYETNEICTKDKKTVDPELSFSHSISTVFASSFSPLHWERVRQMCSRERNAKKIIECKNKTVNFST